MKHPKMSSIVIMTILFVSCGFSGILNQNAFAAPVAINDQSFEATILGDGEYTPNFGAPAPGWTYSINTGVFDPNTTYVVNEAQDGENVAYSNSGTICQTLSANIVANTKYTLFVWLGERSDGYPIQDFAIELKEGTTHTNLASLIDTDPLAQLPPSGDWALNSLTYTALPSDPNIGEPLEICLSSATVQTLFDNVSLDASECTAPPAGQVSWWPAENNADDILYNNPGTAGSGVSFSTGKVGDAFNFDGTNGVNVADSASLDVGTGDFSMDAWIQTTSTEVVQIIVDKRLVEGPAPTVYGYAFFLYDGQLSLQLGDGTYTNYHGTGALLNDGELHHVAVTVDRDSVTGINLYVDGALVDTFNPTIHAGSLDNNDPFLIGQHESILTYNIVGLIDELEFHNVALSSSDISNIYNADVSGKCSADLTVTKFYDANADGINNDVQPIPGWKVSIVGGLVNLLTTTPVSKVLPGISLTVTEGTPTQLNWYKTATNPVIADLATGDKTVDFGNVCTGTGGGHSKGFWTNKNGQALVTAGDLAALTALNLVNADGTAFIPTTNAHLKNWLSSASATNMAYMLSAQLAAMKLNVLHGFVSGSSLVYAPGVGATDFITIDALMAAANTSLGLDQNTPAGDANRAYQEKIKNALDAANNDTSFVKPTPCVFTFP